MLSSSSMESLSDVEEFTVVGEERVIEGGGEDILAARGGGIGQARGKVEVGAWRHDPNVPDSCHVLLVKRRRKCSERWDK